tara:strand:+ start:773 stop:1495 length:723 start_codon:yes stop_codon:yes gene_type:complete
MKLEKFSQIEGTLELLSGLHIGAGNAEMKIGGIDTTVIRHPHTDLPYIPGSSIKGKIRSLLEWRAGVVIDTKGKPLSYGVYEKLDQDKKGDGLHILQLFGCGAGDKLSDEQAQALGPTRVSFWDCSLNEDWHRQAVEDKHLLLTEAKSENTINRITGEASHPRYTERVPAGAQFDFRMTLKQLSTDGDQVLHLLYNGLKLLEMDGLGGSGSRGYGKVRFSSLVMDRQDILPELASIQFTA